jgi:hypothetical protein
MFETAQGGIGLFCVSYIEKPRHFWLGFFAVLVAIILYVVAEDAEVKLKSKKS